MSSSVRGAQMYAFILFIEAFLHVGSLAIYFKRPISLYINVPVWFDYACRNGWFLFLPLCKRRLRAWLPRSHTHSAPQPLLSRDWLSNKKTMATIEDVFIFIGWAISIFHMSVAGFFSVLPLCPCAVFDRCSSRFIIRIRPGSLSVPDKGCEYSCHTDAVCCMAIFFLLTAAYSQFVLYWKKWQTYYSFFHKKVVICVLCHFSYNQNTFIHVNWGEK